MKSYDDITLPCMTVAEGFEARNALAKVLKHLERLPTLLEERLGGNPQLIKEEEKPPTVGSFRCISGEIRRDLL